MILKTDDSGDIVRPGDQNPGEKPHPLRGSLDNFETVALPLIPLGNQERAYGFIQTLNAGGQIVKGISILLKKLNGPVAVHGWRLDHDRPLGQIDHAIRIKRVVAGTRELGKGVIVQLAAVDPPAFTPFLDDVRIMFSKSLAGIIIQVADQSRRICDQ